MNTTNYNSSTIPVERIQIFLEPATIGVGECSIISTKVIPDNASDPTITLRVENEAICSIVDDTITGIAAGTTNIIGTCSNGVSYAVTLTVVNPSSLTYDDFDERSRDVTMKLKIYFDGINNTPLEVTTSDYLIDIDWLEETGAEAKSPVGVVSSNEMSFSMYNTNGMFSPSKTDGPYYGKININIPIRVFISVNKPGRLFHEVGTYYVDTWETGVGKSIVNVSCTDRLRTILDLPMPSLKIVQNETYASFFRRIFKSLGIPSNEIIIDATLTKKMLFSYSLDKRVVDTLQEVSKAAMCYIYVDNLNRIRVSDMSHKKSVVATLSDSNQIKDVRIPQSILKAYSSVELTYSLPKVSDSTALLELNNVSIPSGQATLPLYKVKQGPVFEYLYALIDNAIGSNIIDIHGTTWELVANTRNTLSTPETAKIVFYGRIVEDDKAIIKLLNSATESSIGNKVLKVDSSFIQDVAYANEYAKVLLNFISHDVPTIEIDARGNPLLKLCDCVVVNDATHNVKYSAKIIRAKYKYDGALSCVYTVLNTALLEVS